MVAIVDIATCSRRVVRVSFQVQRCEPIGEITMAKILLLLTRVQALEATVRPDPGEVVHGVPETVWQDLVVVLLETIRRRVLRVRGVRSIRILQRVEAVTGRRQCGTGPF